MFLKQRGRNALVYHTVVGKEYLLQRAYRCEIQACFTVLKIDFFSFTFIAVVSSQLYTVLLITGLSSATDSVHSHDDISVYVIYLLINDTECMPTR